MSSFYNRDSEWSLESFYIEYSYNITEILFQYYFFLIRICNSFRFTECRYIEEERLFIVNFHSFTPIKRYVMSSLLQNYNRIDIANIVFPTQFIVMVNLAKLSHRR